MFSISIIIIIIFFINFLIFFFFYLRFFYLATILHDFHFNYYYYCRINLHHPYWNFCLFKEMIYSLLIPIILHLPHCFDFYLNFINLIFIFRIWFNYLIPILLVSDHQWMSRRRFVLSAKTSYPTISSDWSHPLAWPLYCTSI